MTRIHRAFSANTRFPFSHAVWVYGERAIAAARPYLPEAFERAGAKHLQFTGHCSERHV
ncbi:oxidoreductase, partial [Salmonella enterica subsp. enterica serovar Kentucky]|nr:oxidoreductase [Salmonella enterica subsp. enterica serovar Kentucky]